MWRKLLLRSIKIFWIHFVVKLTFTPAETGKCSLLLVGSSSVRLNFYRFHFIFILFTSFLLILGWFTGMRPTEQRNLLMEDIRPDKTNAGVWIRKTVIKASQGRPAKIIWCIVPYNNKANCTDYGSIIVSWLIFDLVFLFIEAFHFRKFVWNGCKKTLVSREFAKIPSHFGSVSKMTSLLINLLLRNTYVDIPKFVPICLTLISSISKEIHVVTGKILVVFMKFLVKITHFSLFWSFSVLLLHYLKEISALSIFVISLVTIPWKLQIIISTIRGKIRCKL